MWGTHTPIRRQGGRILSAGIIIALLAVIALVIGLVWYIVDSHRTPQSQAPVNPPGCPQVEVIAVPGTWESSEDDDPIHPRHRRHTLLKKVTVPLQKRYKASDVKVYTVPYKAQFRNPTAPTEASYNSSRDQGKKRLEKELTTTYNTCPATSFILTGFSQGAVIAGDVASNIGNGRGPIPADNVIGVALVADGRRLNEQGQNPGKELSGEGLEIALGVVGSSIGILSGSGATMRGPRKGGFGTLDSVTYQLCDKRDVICNATKDPLALITKGQNFLSDNPIHAKYDTNRDVIPGTTATAWIVQWAVNLINKALR